MKKPDEPDSQSDPRGEGKELTLTIREDVDVYWCGGECQRFARAMGFEDRDLWELSIVVRELATNVVKFAGGGQLTLRRIKETRPGIEIVMEDEGPGIEDVEAAQQDGYSEGRLLVDSDCSVPRRGLGSGLGAVKRLMDITVIENRKDKGVRIVARRWLSDSRRC